MTCRQQTSKYYSRGFTLIEVMLVLLLIGLLASVVLMNFSGDSREEKLNQAAHRFQQVFQFVAETAMLKQQEWGLYVDNDKDGLSRYRFFYYQQDKWQLASDPSSLAAVSLPEDLVLTLELEGLPGAEYNLLSQLEWLPEEDEQDTTPVLPQVFILSSGEISPFKLIFTEKQAFQPMYATVSTDFSVPLTRTIASTEQP